MSIAKQELVLVPVVSPQQDPLSPEARAMSPGIAEVTGVADPDDVVSRAFEGTSTGCRWSVARCPAALPLLAEVWR